MPYQCTYTSFVCQAICLEGLVFGAICLRVVTFGYQYDKHDHIECHFARFLCYSVIMMVRSFVRKGFDMANADKYAFRLMNLHAMGIIVSDNLEMVQRRRRYFYSYICTRKIKVPKVRICTRKIKVPKVWYVEK